MGAVAHLESRALTVTPGAEAAVEIRVRNSGTVVDQFSLDVLGDAEAWASAEPATLSLFPGAEEKARIVFRPPRSAEVPAGTMPFGIRVASREDPAGSVVEEGTLEIEPFSDVFAELAPRTSRGSRGATHDLAIDNRGNAPLNAAISAWDPDRLLNFDVKPPGVVADPGTAAFAKVAVRPRTRFWRGQPQSRTFRVELETAAGPPVGVDGTLLQEAILPPWFFKALLALVGLLVLAVLFWLFLLQPTIESSAREQAEEVLAQHGLTPIPQPPGGGNGGNGGNGGGGASPSPTATLAPGATAPPTPAPTLPGGAQPRSERILVGAAISPDAGRTLFVTDLIFSNPSDTATGDIELRLGSQSLLVLRLQNFRDLDFHFVTPIVVGSGEQLSLVCLVPECPPTAAVYVSGYQR